MRKFRIAAALMVVHGGFMEIGGVFCAVLALTLGRDSFDMGQYFSFIVPFFQEHLFMILTLGFIYGVLRVVGAVGLWKNRMWGLALSVINCAVTLMLMPFMLPAGILDGVLAGTALTLILMGYFGERNIPRR